MKYLKKALLLPPLFAVITLLAPLQTAMATTCLGEPATKKAGDPCDVKANSDNTCAQTGKPEPTQVNCDDKACECQEASGGSKKGKGIWKEVGPHWHTRRGIGRYFGEPQD